jgi:hypothetical protein
LLSFCWKKLEQFPITIKCDNVGAIFLANNHCNSQRTKKIDTRRHFVQEWVEDDILKILSTPTLNNTADSFTKNTTEEIFQTLAVKLVKPIPNKAEMCHFTSANMRIWFLRMSNMIGLWLLNTNKRVSRLNG